ncbi:MAG: mechanosensitive ion channel [Bacillota bacterium]|nr:mechanosensitive ion channel [Bacillota bacterium]
MEYIIKLLNNLGESFGFSEIGTRFSIIILVFLLAIIVNLIVKKFILKIVYKNAEKNRFKWDECFKNRKVFSRIANLIPPLIIFLFAPVFNNLQSFVEKATSTYIYIMIILVIDATLNALNDIYKTYDVSKEKPIKSYLQVLKIIIFSFMSIIIISNLIDKSPMLILSGLGVMSAVLMLIFKDAILGLVAGIQLATNEMLQIGDWIEMPQHGADGDVIDISLTTAKIRNFDKTITTIPSYSLVSSSFKNWRGMKEAGARRIKRSILIDVHSVFFLNDEWIEKMKKKELLKDYLEEKVKENVRLTNIGTFRIYLEKYVYQNKKIRNDMTRMVRQLPPTEKGVPVEIYAFADTTAWEEYEKIQSDIFDHVLAVTDEFGLKTYQDLSGNDLKNIGKE